MTFPRVARRARRLARPSSAAALCGVVATLVAVPAAAAGQPLLVPLTGPVAQADLSATGGVGLAPDPPQALPDTESAAPDREPALPGTEPAAADPEPALPGTEPAAADPEPAAADLEPALPGTEAAAPAPEPAAADPEPALPGMDLAAPDPEPGSTDDDHDAADRRAAARARAVTRGVTRAAAPAATARDRRRAGKRPGPGGSRPATEAAAPATSPGGGVSAAAPSAVAALAPVAGAAISVGKALAPGTSGRGPWADTLPATVRRGTRVAAGPTGGQLPPTRPAGPSPFVRPTAWAPSPTGGSAAGARRYFLEASGPPGPVEGARPATILRLYAPALGWAASILVLGLAIGAALLVARPRPRRHRARP